MATIGEDDESEHLHVAASGATTDAAGAKGSFVEAEEVDFDSTRGSM